MTILKDCKQVREMEAAKKIRVIAILKDGKIVSHLQCYLSITSKGFQWRVDVFDDGSLMYQTKGRDLYSALHGVRIQNVDLYRECETSELSEQILREYRAAIKRGNQKPLDRILFKAKQAGMKFTNPGIAGGFQNLYFMEGLDRMKHFGFVIETLL